MRLGEAEREVRRHRMSIFPTKILLATDGSEEAQLALRTAIDLANETDSELHVIHVGRLLGYSGAATLGGRGPLPAGQDALDKEARRLLEAQVKKIEAAGGGVAQAHLGASERPYAEIVSLAEEIGAGLIAIGSRGLGGIRRALVGSVSDSVVRHAHCPVLVVREGRHEEVASIFPTKVLLATDGSEQAELALRTAVDLANRTNSELHVVTVGRAEYRPGYDIPESGDYLKGVYEAAEREAREVLNEQVKKIGEAGGTVAKAHLEMGRRDREIIHLAERIDAGLIAMGSRGLGGVRRALMGSVSDSVVRHAHCPVLVVRAEKGG